jgi:hypothetical protein
MAYADVKFNFSIDDIMLSFLSYANRLNKNAIGYTLVDVNKKNLLIGLDLNLIHLPALPA